MSPDEFIKLAGGFPLPLRSTDKIRELALKMSAGNPIDACFLDIDDTRGVVGHEGRHRAMAAKSLGLDIPVIVYHLRNGSHVNAPPR
jgi:hypothetical protein